jgi:SAM-dependent methyltransferase
VAEGAAADDPLPAWVDALEERHRRNLTFAEVRRGLQALSSVYVERRQKLAAGAALEGAGKRAAFALYYGPTHFALVRAIVRALETPAPRLGTVVDLGCGTGAAGAAWALETGARVEGIDRSGWAIEETRWTLGRLRVQGTARKGDAAAAALPPRGGAVVAAFTANEMPEPDRAGLLATLREAPARGVRVLIVEPLARRALGWWDAWAAAFAALGGREDEWRFPVALPAPVVALGRAAGLDVRSLGGRSLYLTSRPAGVEAERSSSSSITRAKLS